MPGARCGLVEVDTGERHFLFGLGAANPHGGPLAAAQASRTLHELLLAHGASADALQ